MDNPIINPIWFYLVDVIPRFGAFLCFFGVGLGAIGLIVLSQDDKNSKNISIFKKCLISGIIAFIIGVLCPTGDACYQMIAAKMITPNNIKIVTDYVGDTATNVSDNLTEAIKDIMDYSVDRIYNIRNNERAED